MGFKNWCIKTAVNYARPYIKKEISVAALAGYATSGVEWAAEAAVTDKVTDATLARITKGCALGSSIFGVIASAIDPNSESGRGISVTEREAIKANVEEAIKSVITQEVIDAIIDRACDKVVEKLV